MAGRFTVEAVFKAIDKITAPVTRMGNRVGKTLRGINAGVKRVSAGFRKLGKSVGPALGIAGVAGALLAVKMAMGDVITTGADLEQSLVSAGVRFEEPIFRGTKAFEELEGAAREAGRTTEFTANQGALALKFMAKAGFDAQFSIASLPALVDLATASEQDLARAADIVSDSMAAFGLITNDAEKNMAALTQTSDQMVKAANSANLGMEDMFETIKLGAPLATAAGVSMDELIAITARLAQVAIKGSRGGTVLNAMFTKLVDRKVQKNLHRLGVEVLDAGKNIRPFADILDDMAKSLEDVTPAQKAGAIAEIFQIRATRGVLSFLTQGSEELRKLQDQLINVQGETKAMAAVMRDTTRGAMKEFKSAVESVELTLFKTSGATESIAESLTGFTRGVDAFITLNPALTKMTFLLTGLSAIAVAIGLVFAGIGVAISFIVGSTAGLVGLGVAAAGVAFQFGVWLGQLDGMEEGFDRAASRIQRMVDLLAQARGFLGFGGGEEEETGGAPPGGRPEVIGPQSRLTQSIIERRELSQLDIFIKGQADLVDIERRGRAQGFNLQLLPTGGA